MLTGDPVPESSNTPFPLSDAWVLLATGIAATYAQPTLANVICAADMIQHAIITKPELDGAIRRLQQARLVLWNPPILSVTPAGVALLKSAERVGGAYLARQKYLEAQLATKPWAPALQHSETQRGEIEIISSADYANALRTYETRSDPGHNA